MSLHMEFALSKSANACIVNPFNAELNPICPLLALFRAHHILHVSRIRVNTILPEGQAGESWEPSN